MSTPCHCRLLHQRQSQLSRDEWGCLLVLLAVTFGHAQGSKEPLRDKIFARERSGLDSLKTGDMTAFASFLADDAVFVDDRGPAVLPTRPRCCGTPPIFACLNTP